MPPKNRKGGKKNKNVEEEETTPKHETQEETHDETTTTATQETHEEEKQPETDLQASTTEQFEKVEHAEQSSKTEEEPKLESSQNTEVLASSIQSNWDEMQNTQNTEVTEKTLTESVVEPKENLAESTYVPHSEVEEAVKKAVEETVHIQPVEEVKPQPDAGNPFLMRGAQEVQEAFERAGEAAKVETPKHVEPEVPAVSQAEAQEAIKTEEPVKENTVVAEPTVEQIQKEEAHQNPFIVLSSSPIKDAPVVNTEPINPNTVILTRSAEEVQDAINRAEATTTENKESNESWHVVQDKHHHEKPAEEAPKVEAIPEKAAPTKTAEPKEEIVVEENYVVLAHDKVKSVQNVEEKLPKNVEKNSSGSAAEYFLGSLVSTSAITFVAGKYLLKYPTNKGLITSLVAGVVVGGVSLLIQKNIKNKDTTQAKKKN